MWSCPHDGHAWCISFSSATRGTWFSTVRPHVAHAPGCGGSACGVRPHVAYACGRRAARAFEATRGACFRVSASRGRVDIPDHTWSLFLELRPHVVSYPRARPRVVLCFLRPRVDVTDHVWLWGQRVRSSILELGHVWFFCFLRPRVDVIDHVWSSSPAGPRGPSRAPAAPAGSRREATRGPCFRVSAS